MRYCEPRAAPAMGVLAKSMVQSWWSVPCCPGPQGRHISYNILKSHSCSLYSPCVSVRAGAVKDALHLQPVRDSIQGRRDGCRARAWRGRWRVRRSAMAGALRLHGDAHALQPVAKRRPQGACLAHRQIAGGGDAARQPPRPAASHVVHRCPRALVLTLIWVASAPAGGGAERLLAKRLAGRGAVHKNAPTGARVERGSGRGARCTWWWRRARADRGGGGQHA